MLDRLTLDQLRTLVAVADAGSFSAAGRRLHRVQSGVSQAIQALETALGLTLFDRSGTRPALTEAGRVLVADARRLIAGAEAFRSRAESIRLGEESELVVAVEAPLPNEMFMRSLRIVSDAFPELRVTVYTEALGGAVERLRDGGARLALICHFPVQGMSIGAFELGEFLGPIEVAPVVATSHPLARAAGPIGRALIAEHVQLVLTTREPIVGPVYEGAVSHRLWRFVDLHTRLEFLLAGFGWCNMPLHIVNDHIAAGRLKRLQLEEGAGSALPVHVLYPRGRPPGRAGKLLITHLRDQLGAR